MQASIARIATSFIDVPGSIAIAIYFAGCSIRCPGCQNKSLWEKSSGVATNAEDVLKKISNHTLADWVVFLGGEPTDQLEFLEHICTNVTTHKKALYTGREFERLSPTLLSTLDMVVCGPFRVDLYVAGRWPASTNQRIFRKEGSLWTCTQS